MLRSLPLLLPQEFSKNNSLFNGLGSLEFDDLTIAKMGIRLRLKLFTKNEIAAIAYLIYRLLFPR